MIALDELKRLAVVRGAKTVGRYAPSPTGRLHLGNLRTALIAWLQVRLEDGIFILRMEDLDTPRTKPGSAEEIIEDLTWLGIDWDEGPDTDPSAYVQSFRGEVYDLALVSLAEQELTFSCYCSRKDISRASSAPHGPNGPVYPGTCRNRVESPADKVPAVRARVNETVIEFTDRIHGDIRSSLDRDSGDFVIRRADQLFAYQLAVAVDDALAGITDVVRGDDLLDSTPRQLYLIDRLGLKRPDYWHVPLMRDDDGNRMSKRDGSDSLAMMKSQGERPEKVIGMLAASAGLMDKPQDISATELLQTLSTSTLNERLTALGRLTSPQR